MVARKIAARQVLVAEPLFHAVDTATHNLGAGQFYRSLGFPSLGMPRSFVRDMGSISIW